MSKPPPRAAAPSNPPDALVVDALVDRAALPYRDFFPPDEMAALCEELRIFLLTHPVAERVVARVRPEPATGASHARAKPGATAAPPIPAKLRRGGR